MVFIVIASVFCLLINIFSWLFLSKVFYQRIEKKSLFCWFLLLLISIAGHLLVHWEVENFKILQPIIRQQIISFFVFTFVLQSALAGFGVLWCIVLYLLGSIRKWFRNVAFIVIGISFILAIKVAYFPDECQIIEIEIASSKLPKEFDGMKIAQVTDTHVMFPEDVVLLRGKLEKVVDKKPDMLVFVGDLADSRNQIADTVKVFKEVEKELPLGLWFVLGNHEYIQGLSYFLNVYEGLDISLLRNEGKTLYYNNNDFYLAGVDYPFKRVEKADKRGVPISLEVAVNDLNKALLDRKQGQFTILLAHHPMIFDDAFSKEVFLTLSGHTHGFQIGFNRKSLNVFVKYAWGLYENKNSFGYVSSGTGEWFPIRFGAPQEIVIFTLKSVN